MATLKTLNQIYKNSGTTIPYATWIQNGKDLYNEQLLHGMFPPDVTFDMWANAMDYAHEMENAKRKLSSDAAPDPMIENLMANDTTATDTSSTDNTDTTDSPTFLDNFDQFISSISPIAIAALGKTTTTKTTGTTSSGAKAVTATGTTPKASATIAGMSPVVFVLLVAVLLVGGSFAIYEATKK